MNKRVRDHHLTAVKVGVIPAWERVERDRWISTMMQGGIVVVKHCPLARSLLVEFESIGRRPFISIEAGEVVPQVFGRALV